MYGAIQINLLLLLLLLRKGPCDEVQVLRNCCGLSITSKIALGRKLEHDFFIDHQSHKSRMPSFNNTTT